MIMQDGHQHFSVEFFFERAPVDIKIASVERSLAIFENVQPPRIVAAHHSHVVGHDIEDQSHVMFVKNAHKAVKIFGSANLGI